MTDPVTKQLRNHYQNKRGVLAKVLRRRSMQKHQMVCCQKCMVRLCDGAQRGGLLPRPELHHKKQLKHHRRYSTDLTVLKKLLNAPENLAMLCPSCHSEYHRSDDQVELSFEDFMKRPVDAAYRERYERRLRRRAV